MKTVNLPKTAFPMRPKNASLPVLEKYVLEKQSWVSTSDAESSIVVHDGPPYANGNIHIGHAYNKTLKDFLVRYFALQEQPHYVCGWDCHGLPIELAVKKENENLDMTNLDAFREYASKQVENQKSQFAKLGIVINHKYETMSSSFEDEELKCFQELVRKNYVVTRNMPVHWCWSCETCLAESEIEYKDVTDNSVYVLLPCASARFKNLFLLVWTTTPWTLKANESVALNKNVSYVVASSGNNNIVVSRYFADQNKLTVLEEVDTGWLTGCPYLDPFGNDDAVRSVFHADYVTENVGTGLVHIAPSCGKDDYLASQKHFGAGDVKPYTDSKGRIDGIFYKKANKLFVESLKEKKLLWKEESSKHSYPHCWRCNNPTIQRATKQVFLDYSSKKDLILSEAERVKFYPAKTKNRFMSFVLSRTEWCLSRQRNWGVPIPEFLCKDCESHGFDLEVATVTQWRSATYKPVCRLCQSTNTSKGTDTLDVWFDSGLTYRTLKGRVADWVVEGSDQHRGWFQSAHILSCLLENKTCLSNVVSHGFVLDEQGRKMSKSLGNVVDPLKVAEEHGVEVFRLWALSQVVGDDVYYGPKNLEVQKSNYRKIRNTLKYLHSNLYDYKAELHENYQPNKEEMERLASLQKHFHNSFQRVEFHSFLQELMKYMDEISTGYIDRSKDTLYESVADSLERRTIQATYFHLLNHLMEMVQVLLPFTMYELQEYRVSERAV